MFEIGWFRRPEGWAGAIGGSLTRLASRDGAKIASPKPSDSSVVGRFAFPPCARVAVARRDRRGQSAAGQRGNEFLPHGNDAPGTKRCLFNRHSRHRRINRNGLRGKACEAGKDWSG